MIRLLDDCKAVGRRLEDVVAEELRSRGYEVFQHVYVPWHPEDPDDVRVTEIDVVAINGFGVLVVECKNISGRIKGTLRDRTWTYRNGRITNPLSQSTCHRIALWDNLHVPVSELIVFSDYTLYQGPEDSRVVYLRDLQAGIDSIPKQVVLDGESYGKILGKLQELANPNGEMKRKHSVYMNMRKNEMPLKEYSNGHGVEYYCILVGEYYYAFTDDEGHYWGVEKIDEAMLFETEEEVNEQAYRIEGSEPCTLLFGYPELLSDLPDELDEMTPDEYAYAVGARPW